MVNSLFLKKPERIAALGLVFLLALLLWRLMERAMRTHVDTTSTSLPGWDKQATEWPTAFMMITKFAGVIVLKLGHDWQLARPLSVVQYHYLTASYILDGAAKSHYGNEAVVRYLKDEYQDAFQCR
jgi:hypothetical protein